MKKWILGVALFFGIGCIALYLITTQLHVESSQMTMDTKPVGLTNQVWTIPFSQKLDKDTIHNGNVYVKNSDGEKQETEVSISRDGRSIIISPPEEGYSVDAGSYSLHVGKGVKSTWGRNLSSTLIQSFIIKEQLPVIGSKEKLQQYFLTVMKEKKSNRNQFFPLFKEDATEEKAADSSMETGLNTQDHSETNVQVQGIDEGDLVKTDGKYIYQLSDREIRIIQAQPADKMKLAAEITYDESFSANQLYLQGEHLVLIGQEYQLHENQSKQMQDKVSIAPFHQSTKVIVYDISDPTNPNQVRDLTLEGHMTSTRKIGSIVYLVTSHYPDYWLLEENEDMDIRPRMKDSAVHKEIQSISYEDIQYFPETKETNYLTIAAFDMEKSKDPASIQTFLGSGGQLYMSKENIYIGVENYIFSESDFIYDPDTTIYRFSIDQLSVNLTGSTKVNGRILNQFSMDEHDGFFRVATTKGQTWDESKPSTNQLYIFDKKLKQMGALENLAKGERIYSARFMGDRIYIVTFKETDPLFVIDASKPAEPKVLGELKIPGFSNYLHPYDENHVIGFGHDTKIVTDKNSTQPRILTNGVKISMFDITNPTQPKEKFTEIIGGRGTYSPLNHDHKALLFDKKKNIFAFPINIYNDVEGSEYEQTFEFQGAYVYSIDSTEGLSLQSKITHHDGKASYEEWESEILRLLYIGENLYALSNTGISAHSLKGYQLMGQLTFQ
ncbi:beta-propeller domain-containing protein [Cytobacillus spongiae]|uniref:beta-propeller domain-containing protein n=1 Tax=Cytobacillus spongiae TaxID=2901381 RepID=UPI001F264DD3|nr:beta-propeller domain-containing protein [Cytobacillus spongiae]UII56836.1 beta-propeller domain-containing protein [Cytobacillus spongiae]